MNKGKKGKKVGSCAERERLWNAFLAVGNEWNLMQAEMAKQLQQQAEIHPDMKKLQSIQERIERSHQLFAKHIEKHGCWPVQTTTSKPGKNYKGKRK